MVIPTMPLAIPAKMPPMAPNHASHLKMFRQSNHPSHRRAQKRGHPAIPAGPVIAFLLDPLGVDGQAFILDL